MPLFMAPPLPPPLSFLSSLSFPHHLHLPSLSGAGAGGDRRALRRGDLAVRMGGGPRTFPGGVTKWQWKRMQAKKAKQLLKARLARERQLYEMRKRAELHAAVAELERPWDPVSRSHAAAAAAAAAPNLMSVAADEQLKALADRFHRPGGLDLWNERDGPQVFASPATGMASARFFPKNAVHSTQPYRVLPAGDEADGGGRGGLGAEVGRPQGVRENAGERARIGDGEFEPQWRGMAKPANGLDDDDNYDDGRRNRILDNVASDSEEMRGGGFKQQGLTRSRGHGRSGMARWRPANVLDDGNDGGGERDQNGDHIALSLEDLKDGSFESQQRARDGRRNGRARQRPTNAMNVRDDNGDKRDLNGDGFISDSEGARDDGFEPKWQAGNRTSDRRDGAGRWKPSSAMNAGDGIPDGRGWTSSGSVSGPEETRNGRSERRWRASNRDNGMRNGVARWKPSNAMNVVHEDGDGEDWNHGGFNSDSKRDGGFKQKWNGRNRADRRENGAGKSKLTNGTYASEGGDNNRVRSYGRGNTSRGIDWIGDGFASDLEEPRWKATRDGGRDGRKNGASRWKSSNGMNAGGGRGHDKTGRPRRGGIANGRGWSSDGNRVGRRTPMPNTTSSGGEEDGGRSRRYQRGGSRGRQFNGAGHSLRPTSEMYSSWNENGSHETD